MAQGHELDKEHLAKELGDIAWYLAEAATALEIPLDDIFQANIDKLKNCDKWQKAAKEPGDKTVFRFFCAFL